MELINNKRNEFQAEIKSVLEGRVYTINECYPFEDLGALEGEVTESFRKWGINWVGSERFGETITFGGEWITEGVALEININPTITGEGFRTLIRWR
jgi:hypothetical protein